MPSMLLLRCVRLFAACLCLLWAACTPVHLMEDLEAYERTVERLQRRLLAHPEDARALRDLGALYVRTNHYSTGHDYLREAFARDPRDPKTLFYLGLASELVGERQAALRLYEHYPDVPRRSPYRRLMQGRYGWLVRSLVRDEIQALLAAEVRQAAGPASPRVVAVFPFVYQGGDSRYDALGRGLAEMVTVDLASVRHLTVVERTRLQVLLDELALGRGAPVDPATAPRLGQLLGAGRIVGGSYNVFGGRTLRLDAALVASAGASSPAVGTSGALDNLFTLEKQLVFRLIDEMGIELTPEEREQIESVPTQNLQAFLAYSRGLEREDAGAYREAAVFYRRAGRLDPGFRAAAQRAEAAEGVEAAAGPMEAILMVAGQVERADVAGLDLTRNRLENLNEGVGASVVPGQDTREPAQEVLQELPLPPPPPRDR